MTGHAKKEGRDPEVEPVCAGCEGKLDVTCENCQQRLCSGCDTVVRDDDNIPCCEPCALASYLDQAREDGVATERERIAKLAEAEAGEQDALYRDADADSCAEHRAAATALRAFAAKLRADTPPAKTVDICDDCGVQFTVSEGRTCRCPMRTFEEDNARLRAEVERLRQTLVHVRADLTEIRDTEPARRASPSITILANTGISICDAALSSAPLAKPSAVDEAPFPDWAAVKRRAEDAARQAPCAHFELAHGGESCLRCGAAVRP